jgi:transcriptional regulator with XRE-family HTH domain
MKIRFQSLQENLRASIWARLERGELTGKSLARKAGFRQAHLSNFLNRKRGLSLQAMDRLLDVLHIDVLQLAGADEVARPALQSERNGEVTEAIAVVTLAVAARRARFSPDDVQDTVSFRRSFLRSLKPQMIGNRRDWTRFAVVNVDGDKADDMVWPLRPGTHLLLDRHCNAPPRSDEPSLDLYAVIYNTDCLIVHITVTQGHLILRSPHENHSSPVRLLPVPAGRRGGDFIIGRVRHISTEV